MSTGSERLTIFGKMVKEVVFTDWQGHHEMIEDQVALNGQEFEIEVHYSKENPYDKTTGVVYINLLEPKGSLEPQVFSEGKKMLRGDSAKVKRGQFVSIEIVDTKGNLNKAFGFRFDP